MEQLIRLGRTLCARALPVGAVLLFLLPAAQGQRLLVRLLNAETGGPMGHENVTVSWDVDSEESTVAIGGDGLGTVQVPPGAQAFRLSAGPATGPEPFRIPFVTCNAEADTSFTVEQAGRYGAVPANGCTQRVTRSNAGEIVFWARPAISYRADLPHIPGTAVARR